MPKVTVVVVVGEGGVVMRLLRRRRRRRGREGRREGKGKQRSVYPAACH